MIPKAGVCTAAVLMLVACATPDLAQAPIAVPRGPAPTTAQGEAAVRVYLATHLKDPDSLKQFRIQMGPTEISWPSFGGREQGWVFCFEYNAKNSYGGFTGLQHDGLVMRMKDGKPYVIPINWAIASTGC